MNKILLVLAAMLLLGVGTAFAAPLNNLTDGQTAIGWVGDKGYIENKVTNNVTVGLENNEIYGQYGFTKNLRLIVGGQNYNSNSSCYAGLGVIATVAPKLDAYASLVGGDGFSELQVGANLNVLPNLDLNVNYRSTMPEIGSNIYRVGVGATFKF
jgi:hypothetical protein